MKKNGVLALTLILGLIAAACGGNPSARCTPGASVACTGPGGCAGGQTCSSDGADFGSCVCGGGSTVPSGTGSTGSSSGGSPPGICSPCWQDWACCTDVSCSQLVYFGGTSNADGSCTLTQNGADGGAFPSITLECGGKTDQASSWIYSNVSGLGLQVQFTQAGSVYTSGGGVESDVALYCGKT